MKIKPEDIKENQLVHFVYANRRVVTIKAYYYEKESGTLWFNEGARGIELKQKPEINLYTKKWEAAQELADYHLREWQIYNNRSDEWWLEDEA